MLARTWGVRAVPSSPGARGIPTSDLPSSPSDVLGRPAPPVTAMAGRGDQHDGKSTSWWK